MPQVEIRFFAPDILLRPESIRQAIEHAQDRKTGPKMRALFKKTVEGWKNKPYFFQRKHITPRQIGIVAHSGRQNVDQYFLVNEGAAPHYIRPRRARRLRFQPGYRPSTRPHILSSRPMARFGDPVTASVVRHPGFEARKFDEAVAKAHAPDFRRDMQQAIHDGVIQGMGRR